MNDALCQGFAHLFNMFSIKYKLFIGFHVSMGDDMCIVQINIWYSEVNKHETFKRQA
jgi:hypothetical protein